MELVDEDWPPIADISVPSESEPISANWTIRSLEVLIPVVSKSKASTRSPSRSSIFTTNHGWRRTSLNHTVDNQHPLSKVNSSPFNHGFLLLFSQKENLETKPLKRTGMMIRCSQFYKNSISEILRCIINWIHTCWWRRPTWPTTVQRPDYIVMMLLSMTHSRMMRWRIFQTRTWSTYIYWRTRNHLKMRNNLDVSTAVFLIRTVNEVQKNDNVYRRTTY